MGLKLTLNRENNRLYTDFVDAYWVIDRITYSTQHMAFALICYPSRDAKMQNNVPMPSSTLPIGGVGVEVYGTELYRWQAQLAIIDIFPGGIPLDENTQKTAIYNWIKAYTNLPFEDVLEEGQG